MRSNNRKIKLDQLSKGLDFSEIIIKFFFLAIVRNFLVWEAWFIRKSARNVFGKVTQTFFWRVKNCFFGSM